MRAVDPVKPNETEGPAGPRSSPSNPESGDLGAGSLFRIPSPKEEVESLDGIALGCQFGAVIVVFVGLGLFLDSWLHSSPLFVILFLFLGFGGALYSVIRRTNAMGGKEGPRSRGKSGEPPDPKP